MFIDKEYNLTYFPYFRIFVEIKFMIKEEFISFFLGAVCCLIVCLLPDSVLGQAPGCPNVNAGPDTTLTCNPACVDLTATMLETGTTTSYLVNSIPYAPPFPFTGGTSIFVNQDDIWSGVINLPFNFCFYGNTFNQILIGANGLLTFNVGMANAYCEWSYTATIPTPGPPPGGIYNNSINGAYHDIDPSVFLTGAAKDINYAVLGTPPCRTFVVNYYEIPHFWCNNLITTQQIVLYETTNAIEVYINDKPTCNTWNSGNAVIGLQNANGTQGIAAPGRNTGPWSTNNEAWRFVPDGPQNFSIEWFDGTTSVGTGNPISVCPLIPTDYTAEVTYTNCDGSTVVETDTVLVTPAICGCSASINATTDPTCDGVCDGTATVTVNTGTAPYTYSWSPTGGTGPVGTGLCANVTYTVVVIDANSDTCTASTFLSSPPALLATATTVSDPNCYVAPDGVASVAASGGTSPYTYAWSSGGTWLIESGLSGGVVYTVTVTDANGCSTTDTVSLNEPICSCTASITSSTNTSCDSVCDGTATVAVNSGISPYTYSWSPAGGTGSVATGLCGNVAYTVMIIDGNTDTCYSTVAVTSPAPLLATATVVSDPNCYVAPDGNASVAASGGTTPYSYVWSPTGGTGAVGTGLSGGVVYTVAVTDSNGCTTSDTVSLNVPICFCTPAITLTTNPSCYGGCDGTATATLSTGLSPYTYSWSPGGGTGAVATGLCADTLYQLMVIDANADTCYTSVTLTNPPVLGVSIVASTDPTCMGLADGSATAAGSGGTGAYTYDWSPSGDSVAGPTGLAGGLHTVTVTDANGCTQTDTVMLVNPPSVLATIISSNNPLCDTSLGDATVTASGGTTPYTYIWSPAGGIGTIGTGLSGGISYAVSVMDANGCMDIDSIELVAPPPIVLATIAVNDPSCANTSDGSIEIAATGGTGAYTYNWSPSVSTASIGNGLADTTYTIQVLDSAGCYENIQITLSSPLPVTATITGDAEICFGDTANLSVSATGGTPSYSYLWVASGKQDSTLAETPATNTTYNAVVFDNNGCLDTSTFDVVVHPLPMVAFDADTNSGCAPLTVVFNNLSDSAVSCSWDIGDGIVDSCGSFTHTYTTPGTYDVQLSITDTNGCVGSWLEPDYIDVFETPTADFQADPWVASINTPTIDFTDQSAFSDCWEWDFGGLDTSNLENPTYVFPSSDTGSYPVFLWVCSSNGCTDTITKWVFIKGDFMLFAPNSFTPNGDGFNDLFTITGMGFKRKEMKISIFNRWGGEIFTTESGESWDGQRQNGTGVITQEVYVWIVTVLDEQKKVHQAVGHVTVIP